MKKLSLNKKELVKLWKTQCAEAGVNTVLEKSHSLSTMYFIRINADLSLALLAGTIKVIFGGYVEYISEDLSHKEFTDLENAFMEAEETILRLRTDLATSNGLKALERLLDGD